MKRLNSKATRRCAATAGLAILLSLASGPASAQIFDFERAWDDAEISGVLHNAGALRSSADTLNKRTGGVGDVVRVAKDNLDILSDNFHEVLAHARAEAAQLLEEEMTAATEFAGPNGCASPSPCHEFRGNLLRLLDDLGSIAGTLVRLELDPSGPNLLMDFQRERQLIAQAPPFALYPFYRAMTLGGDLFASGLLGTTARASDGLVVANAVLVEDAVAGFETCRLVQEHTPLVREASFKLLDVAVKLKIVAAAMNAEGETRYLANTKRMGVHGYFAVHFENNRAGKGGVIVDAVAEVVGKVSTALDDQLIYCAALWQRDSVMAAVEANNSPRNR
jgi:primosomal replication protein N